MEEFNNNKFNTDVFITELQDIRIFNSSDNNTNFISNDDGIFERIRSNSIITNTIDESNFSPLHLNNNNIIKESQSPMEIQSSPPSTPQNSQTAPPPKCHQILIFQTPKKKKKQWTKSSSLHHGQHPPPPSKRLKMTEN